MSNNITITGRIAQDPELRFAQSGKAMCNLSIPDQKRKKNDRGEWEDAHRAHRRSFSHAAGCCPVSFRSSPPPALLFRKAQSVGFPFRRNHKIL